MLAMPDDGTADAISDVNKNKKNSTITFLEESEVFSLSFDVPVLSSNNSRK